MSRVNLRNRLLAFPALWGSQSWLQPPVRRLFLGAASVAPCRSPPQLQTQAPVQPISGTPRDHGIQPSGPHGRTSSTSIIGVTSPPESAHYMFPSSRAKLTPSFSSLFPPRRAFGRLPEDRSQHRPTSDRARPRRRSCRASSTTCTARSAGTPPASPPRFPGGRAA